MLTPQFGIPLHHELVVDLFAGGGGASTGIEQAIGRHVDIAVNHDPEAISLHQANHPQTRHFVSDVFEVDPVAVTHGRPVGLLWASPDCTYHSKARGGKPHRDRNRARRRRGLAWVVCKWAREVRPRIIALENVEEFQDWGPLRADGTPCPERRGKTFSLWVAQLRNLGYSVEWRELRACDYGAPTIRKRLFLVARCDGLPIEWPAATHGDPKRAETKARGLKPWRTAAECIDWSISCPSIFERKKPLADATCRRIAKGIMRYVVESAEPFIVKYHSAKRTGDDRVGRLADPLPTQTTENRFALVTPFLTECANASTQRNFPASEPLRTQVSQVKGGHFALVCAFLAKHYGGVVGSDLDAPIGTVTSVDHHSLVAANLIHMGHGEGKDGSKRFSHGIRSAEDPLNTVTAQGSAAGLVQAFLVAYYGSDEDGQALNEPLRTVPTRDRFGLVMVKGEPYFIADIGLRMLQPHELYAAQGFPATYQHTKGADGRPLTKTAQVRMCGNSVCPPVARAIVAANYAEEQQARAA